MSNNDWAERYDVDYSLLGFPQLPPGWFWIYDNWRTAPRKIQLPFGAQLVLAPRRVGTLSIQSGSVSRHSYSGSSRPLRQAEIRRRRSSMSELARIARRLIRGAFTVEGTSIPLAKKEDAPTPADLLDPIKLFNFTQEHS